MTIIKPTKDLYNKGKCFTKGKRYTIDRTIHNNASLMEVQLINDLGEHHVIGSWWRDFVIVQPTNQQDDDQ